MQEVALVLEPPAGLVEGVGGVWRGLVGRRSHVRQDDVDVVKASEHVLHLLEPREWSGDRAQTAFTGEFERVAETLGGDAHLVERIGPPEHACQGDAVAQPAGSRVQQVREAALPALIGRGAAQRGQGGETLIEPLHLSRSAGVQQLGACGLPSRLQVAHPLTLPPSNGGHRRQCERLEHRHRHVALAYGAERSRHAPEDMAKTTAACAVDAGGDHRDGLAQPACGHAGLMHPLHRAPAGAVDVREQGGVPGREHASQPRRRLHATIAALSSHHGHSSMRIAAIDIGTNSVHMIIVQVLGDRSFDVIDREKVMVRLGAGGLDGRALTTTAMEAGLQALARFRRLAESHQVDEIVTAATSATREAENGGDFLAAIASQTGIRAQVITGPEEARLIHMAAAYGTAFAGATVVIDIGGGSVEITWGTGEEPEVARSFKAGVIRLSERFVRSDPFEPRDQRRLVTYVDQEVGGHLRDLAARGFARVIGTSGTMTSLGTLALTHQGQAVGDVRNLQVPARAFHRLRKHLVTLDLQERLAIDGLDPKRADLAPAGIVLIDTLLRGLGADAVTLSDYALREGLVLDYIRRNRRHIATIEQFPDPRRRSVIELGERHHCRTPHVRHVAALSLRVFDGTRPAHELGDREREWLDYGALLHDVGLNIGYKAHHRHSSYLIRHGELRGFTPEEIEIIALVARYHRRGRPKRAHDGYASLPRQARRAVRWLSACVRVAESLDRSHAQLVTDVQVALEADVCRLRLQATGDAELEAWAAQRQTGPLSRLLKRPVHVELLPAPRARHRPGGVSKQA